MTQLYLDTEFNGFGGELISMALVGDDQQWYRAVEFEGPVNEWVKEHVIPVLAATAMRLKPFRRSFHEYIRQFRDPEVICDWHADAGHFCRLLAGTDYGSSLDFACRITILKTPPGQPQSRIPHNALADAQALRMWHLQELAA